MSLIANTLSATSVRAAMERNLADQREKEDQRAEAARVELERLRKQFAESHVQPEAIELIASLVDKAVARNQREVLVMRFPSAWLPDHGRAINNQDKSWPEKLHGFGRRAYEYYEEELRPRGFEIKATILEWPDGMPGDVGLFLTW